MTKQHTPGPWVTKDALSPSGAPIIFSTSTHRVICALYYERTIMTGEWGVFENHEANARLIAAAPDLLEALEEMCLEQRMAGTFTEGRRKAQAAIAKAKGKA